MKICKSEIPVHSEIRKYLPCNYHDTFMCITDEQKNISTDDIMVAFWTTMPKWLNILFKIRDTLVKPFGLVTGENGDSKLLGQAIRNGGDYKLMSVVGKTENETVISLNDKHLIAYFSVYMEKEEKRKIYLTTLVRFHNKLGFIYFYAIRPFHAIVVKNMFQQVLKDLKFSNVKV